MAARKMFEQAESSGCASRLPNSHLRHRAVTRSLTPQFAPATCPDGQFPFGCPGGFFPEGCLEERALQTCNRLLFFKKRRGVLVDSLVAALRCLRDCQS